MELFVPDSPALGVPVEGFFKDTDGVIVFGGTVRVKPARGPQIFREADPSSPSGSSLKVCVGSGKSLGRAEAALEDPSVTVS